MWSHGSKSHICFHQIQHVNTWILQGTRPLLQSSETARGSQEKRLYKETKAIEKTGVSILAGTKREERKENTRRLRTVD